MNKCIMKTLYTSVRYLYRLHFYHTQQIHQQSSTTKMLYNLDQLQVN